MAGIAGTVEQSLITMKRLIVIMVMAMAMETVMEMVDRKGIMRETTAVWKEGIIRKATIIWKDTEEVWEEEIEDAWEEEMDQEECQLILHQDTFNVILCGVLPTRKVNNISSPKLSTLMVRASSIAFMRRTKIF